MSFAREKECLVPEQHSLSHTTRSGPAPDQTIQREHLAPIFFYILAAVTIVATILAITARQPVHAIVYLVTSFFAMAAIFYLLAAPLVAVFEVIIYAGAIMVLFLFVIMMLDLGHPERVRAPSSRQWWPAVLLSIVVCCATACMVSLRIISHGGNGINGARDFARALFTEHGIAVELISLQLLFALVGALYLGKGRKP